MFICMQKVNFISNFFFEILKRLYKTCYLGTLEIVDHLHQNHSINLKQAFMLIYMQKTNCTTHYLLKILQRNSKLVILGNMGMLGHTHLKWQNHFTETFDVYQAKNFILHVFHGIFIAKILLTCCFGYFEHAWLRTSQVILSSCRKLLCLSTGKKSTSSPCFNGDIAKI